MQMSRAGRGGVQGNEGAENQESRGTYVLTKGATTSALVGNLDVSAINPNVYILTTNL